jgi:uncharacterized membrane protein YecN with MAPEG domain
MSHAPSLAPVTSIFSGVFAVAYALLSLRVALHRLIITTRSRQAGSAAELSKEEVQPTAQECAHTRASSPRAPQAGNLKQWVRVHGNFQEYVPLCIVLSLLLELNDVPRAAVYAPNLVLVSKRRPRLGRLRKARSCARQQREPVSHPPVPCVCVRVRNAQAFARVAHAMGLLGVCSCGSRANPWRTIGFGLTVVVVAYIGVYVLIRGASDLK